MMSADQIDALPTLDGTNEAIRIWKRTLHSLGKSIAISCATPIIRELIPQMAAAGLGASNHNGRFQPIDKRVDSVLAILDAAERWIADPCDDKAKIVSDAMPNPSYEFNLGLAKPGKCVVSATEHVYYALLGGQFAKSLISAFHDLSSLTGWPHVDQRLRVDLRNRSAE